MDFITYINNNQELKTALLNYNSGSYSTKEIDEDYLVTGVFINDIRQFVSNLQTDPIQIAVINEETFDGSFIQAKDYCTKGTSFSIFSRDTRDLKGSSEPLQFPAVQNVQVTNFSDAVGSPYLHKYKTPYVRDKKQKWTQYNRYIVTLSTRFETTESTTYNRIVNNYSWDNQENLPFANYDAIDPESWNRTSIMPFTNYIRFMDWYIKIEPIIAAFPTYDGTNTWGEVNIQMDVRTNEMQIKYFGYGFPDAELQTGGREIKAFYVKPILGGQKLTTDHFIITIMNEPLV